MKFLVDAEILSEPTKQRPHPAVVEWLRRHERDLLINPVIMGELEYGILLLPAGKRRTRLLEWFAIGIPALNVVELDAQTASHWARLLAKLKKNGRAMPIKDSLIAASARQHNLTIATRNTRDYRHADVDVVNPFDG